MKKKILIIAPISNYGGRELETGFIAQSLSRRYNVSVLSTADMSNKSQIFNFVPSSLVSSLKQTIFKKNLVLKLLAYLSYYKSRKKGKVFDYVSNKWTKRYFNYHTIAVKHLKSIIKKYNVVFLCANLGTSFIKDIIEFAYIKNIPIIFRTTGLINVNDVFEDLNHVNLFLHHSENNASRLSILKQHHYKIIDQCAYIESQLLKLKPSKKIENILYVGRITKDKGIGKLLKYITRIESHINFIIIGDGPLLGFLKKKYKSNNNIVFEGFVKSKELVKFYKQTDALIISSLHESGPITGLEAMAAGKLIITTKVGSMMERLDNTLNQFWYNIHDFKSFQNVIKEIEELDSNQLVKISKSIKQRYLSKYTFEKISNAYIYALNQIDTIFNGA